MDVNITFAYIHTLQHSQEMSAMQTTTITFIGTHK